MNDLIYNRDEITYLTKRHDVEQESYGTEKGDYLPFRVERYECVQPGNVWTKTLDKPMKTWTEADELASRLRAHFPIIGMRSANISVSCVETETFRTIRVRY